MARLSTTTLFTLAILAPLILLLDRISHTFWVFSPAKLQTISQSVIAQHGDDLDGLMRGLVSSLQAEYPGLIEDFDESKWVFNIAGGATGSMHILHASLTEYLIIFGSAVGTEGHSGIHLAQDYFTILAGTQTAEFLGELKPRVYLPGDQHHHPRLTSAHYRLDNASWALELAQGVIPAMLPFGLVQMPLSMDLDSLWRTVWYTGRSTVVNLLNGKI